MRKAEKRGPNYDSSLLKSCSKLRTTDQHPKIAFSQGREYHPSHGKACPGLDNVPATHALSAGALTPAGCFNLVPFHLGQGGCQELGRPFLPIP